MTQTNPDSTLEAQIIELLHKYDHEPDEITKYVVIDQEELVPALTTLFTQYVEGALGEDERSIVPRDEHPLIKKSKIRFRNQLRAEIRTKLGITKDKAGK